MDSSNIVVVGIAADSIGIDTAAGNSMFLAEHIAAGSRVAAADTDIAAEHPFDSNQPNSCTNHPAHHTVNCSEDNRNGDDHTHKDAMGEIHAPIFP